MKGGFDRPDCRPDAPPGSSAMAKADRASMLRGRLMIAKRRSSLLSRSTARPPGVFHGPVHDSVACPSSVLSSASGLLSSSHAGSIEVQRCMEPSVELRAATSAPLIPPAQPIPEPDHNDSDPWIAIPIVQCGSDDGDCDRDGNCRNCECLEHCAVECQCDGCSDAEHYGHDVGFGICADHFGRQDLCCA